LKETFNKITAGGNGFISVHTKKVPINQAVIMLPLSTTSNKVLKHIISKHNMNKILSVAVFLGVLMSAAFAANTIEVQYATHVSNDGELADWSGIASKIMITSTNYLYFGEKLDYLCSAFYIRDITNDASKDYIKFVFDIDGDGVYTQANDFGRAFTRNGKVYVLNDSWEMTNVIQNPTLFRYITKDSGGSWQGELCIKYSMLEITPGTEKALRFATTEWNDQVYINGWPSDGWGTLTSATNWMSEGWCNANNDCKINEVCLNNSCISQLCVADTDCADNQYCAPTAAGDKCILVPTGTCGHVKNHKWNEYECCNDSACNPGKTCTNNVCTSGDKCTTDFSCADNEYCAVSAEGNKCLTVTGTCGYAANHKWNNYQCCANEDCAQTEYCSGNTCKKVETKSCGQIVNHTWESFECCADGGCAKGKICVENKCTENTAIIPSYCSGKIGLNVYYYDRLNGLMAAEIVGLENCNGNVVFVRKDSCTGGATCAFNIGSNGNNCTFSIPKQPGIYKYVACVNIDGDTTYGPNETDSVIVEIGAESCKSVGCTPKTFGQCICEGDSKTGYKTGVCIDNCLNKGEHREECSCGPETVKPTEEITPEEQVPVKTQEVVVPPAPKVPIEYWQIAAVICILAIPILLHFLTKGKK